MRVLMTVSVTSLMDGICRHVLTIARQLNRPPKVEVAVVTLLPPGELNEVLERAGVRNYSLKAPNGHYFPVIGRFLKVLQDFKPDIIHIHTLAFFEQFVLRFCPCTPPIVTTIHGVGGPARERRTIFDLKFNHKFFISKGILKYYLDGRDTLGVSTSIAYNPVSFVESRRVSAGALQRLLNVPQKTRIIGSAMRIVIHKNPLGVCEILCRALVDNRDVHGVIMGDGDKDIMAKMYRTAETFGVAERFHLPGCVRNAPELMADLSCFVLASPHEGMPTALLEAIAAKTPVAFTRGGGGLIDLDELNASEGPFAMVSDTGDYPGLVEQVNCKLKDEQAAEEMASRAWQVGKKHFDVIAVCDDLQRWYKKIVSGKDEP